MRKKPVWQVVLLVCVLGLVLVNLLISERIQPVGKYDYIFLNRMGKPLSRFGIWNIIKKYKAKAALGVPSLKSKKVTPHTII